MSVPVEPFTSDPQSSPYATLSDAPKAVFPYRLQCRMCGFEPDDAVTPPRRCPKCHGSAWERFAFPRAMLMVADRDTQYEPAEAAQGRHVEERQES
jgi:hypothetical protein